MLAVRTPGAPQTARGDAGRGSAFPFERQGRPLRSRSISGLFSRSLYSGLQPPCLRFAAAVTGRHARLGTRLLARLCHDRHLRRQTSTRLQGATLTEPDLRTRIRLFGPIYQSPSDSWADANGELSSCQRNAPAGQTSTDREALKRNCNASELSAPASANNMRKSGISCLSPYSTKDADFWGDHLTCSLFLRDIHFPFRNPWMPH